MSNNTVSVTLQLRGQQAQNVINQISQSQKSTANELLRTNRMLEGVLRQQANQTRIQQQQLQQLSRQTQLNTQNVTRQTQQSQMNLKTNQLLERILQQQTRQSSLQTQQVRNQSREYQLQLNMLRQQVAAAERLRLQLEQAGRAGRGIGGNGTGGGIGGNGLQNTAAVVGGVYAAGAIGANYLKDPREYMKQISLATDTAIGADKVSLSEFNQKVMQMESFVRNASVKGGSSPQDTVTGLNTLTASNVYDFNQLESILLNVSKTAFASGGNPSDVASMAVAQKNFGLTDISKANDQAFRSGQLGSFELKDMARFMPDLLTQGKNSGYIGENGYKNLLTMMQVSTKTAADPSQAATNLSDLLGSFSQYHFGLQMAKFIKVENGDPTAAYGVSKKKTGFDWTTYSAQKREQGIGQVEAAAQLLQRQMQGNSLYLKYQTSAQQALKNKDSKAYQENVQAATNIVGQSEFGKIFHNKQQLSAMMAIVMNSGVGGEYERVSKGIDNSQNAIETSHARQAAQEYGKDSSFDTANFNAKVDNYNGVAGWLGDLKQGLADFASSNSGVAAAASAAVVGLTAVAAAGGVAALAMRGGAGGIGAAVGGAMGAARSAGLVSGAGLLSYGLTTMALNTQTGQKFQNNLEDKTSLGSDIAEVLAFFGNDAAQESIDNIAKYDEMIAQQEQSNRISQDMVNKLSSLINVTQQNKPISMMMGGGSLLDAVNRNAVSEEKRHGAALLMYKSGN